MHLICGSGDSWNSGKIIEVAIVHVCAQMELDKVLLCLKEGVGRVVHDISSKPPLAIEWG